MSADVAEFHAAARAAAKANPEWRLGQSYFNTLEEVRPDIAAKIRGSVADCFYQDWRIPDFLSVVWRLWDEARP